MGETSFAATAQLASKFTACIGQKTYLTRFFAWHEELHAFDARVSRLLVQETMLASYATRNLYVLIWIPTRDFRIREMKLFVYNTL